MKHNVAKAGAECIGEMTAGRLDLCIKGNLNSASISLLWKDVRDGLRRKGIKEICVDSSGIETCDGAGIGLLVYIRQVARRLEASLEFQGLNPDLAGMIDLYPADKLDEAVAGKPAPNGLIFEVGKTTVEALCGLKDHIAFMGELLVGLFRTLLHPSSIRLRDFMLVVEASGARALPIIAMLGFLIGLILAFQGAVLMAQFGAEIYIADFVGKSVARELGPLITAIIVAGRTGSAFAAELGTMKVNEEIDAFTTMGLDPVRFLVIPRVLAATWMTPLLAVLTNLFALAGGAIVMKGLGFPLVTYVNRVLAAVTLTDFSGGLIKAFVFGLLISGAGCLCGLRTGTGASAVGNSATRAVVSSIIMIVIADGVFAVLFYFLGI